MKYKRPKVDARLTKQDKVALMRDYVEYYRRAYATDPAVLNRKIPREAFADLLDAIGSHLLRGSAQLANTDGQASRFLNDNPLPSSMHKVLPRETQAFCLALNALKQWLSAEQQAMDRLILGGSARQICRAAASTCIVTGIALDRETTVLHHPVRDGRPPIPLSEQGHDQIEMQVSAAGTESVDDVLLNLKHEGRRSWVQLRRGCLDLLGRPVNHSTAKVGATSKAFARKASRATGLSYEGLLEWLDRKGFGIVST